MIERTLQGRSGGGPPASVEGQVHQLIEEATSLENLAKVFRVACCCFGTDAFRCISVGVRGYKKNCAM
jgi:hypothetical protein